MKIKLILIGDELLKGSSADENAYWLGRLFFQKKLKITKVVTIEDNLKEMAKEFRDSFKKFDLTITSGGLGITNDDLTRKALSIGFGRELIYDSMAEKYARKSFHRFKKPYPTKNPHPYSFVPQGFTSIPNHIGVAPGLAFLDEANKKLFFSAPGVPKEFQGMTEASFYPLIKEMFQNNLLMEQVVIKTKLIPEEKLFSKVAPRLWKQLEKFGTVSSLPHTLGVDVVITIQDETQEKINEKKGQITKTIEKSPLEFLSSIWQIGDKSLPEYIVQKCKEKKYSLSFAESCTGGLAAHTITQIPGSSTVFNGSVVSYSNEIKANTLGVLGQSLEKGAVSESVAKEMAQGAQKNLNSDFAISYTGIAGPDGGTEENPVGTVYIGVATPKEVFVKRFEFVGERTVLKEKFMKMGLHLLLEEMTK